MSLATDPTRRRDAPDGAPGPNDGPSGPQSAARRVGAWGAKATRVVRGEVRFGLREYIVRVVSSGLPQFSFNRMRTATMRAGGARIGAGSAIMGAVEVTGPHGLEGLSIGEGTMVSGPIFADVGAPIHVGNRVHFGHHIMLLTMTHEIGTSEERCGPIRAAPISIGDGVWIGSGVTILPGVTIGAGAVVAAGAVVNRNVPPDTLVAGVPAQVVRHLDRDPPSSVASRPPPAY